MKITLIVGARPNFIKIAPLVHEIERQHAKFNEQKLNCSEDPTSAEKIGRNIHYSLVHTGQHYDYKMSDSFFADLNIPEPDVNLGCSGGTQAEQTAAIMVAFEKELIANPSDIVLVVGDVTSTMACAIVAKKLNTKVAHVEAGIRSFDLTMPEEINRMVTDSITDYFFTTSKYANSNLRKAGVLENKIFFVGNVMIDTLLANRHRFQKPKIYDDIGLKEGRYLVLTLHRPANVDDSSKLKALVEAILESSRGLPVIFPVHPRTAKIIVSLNSLVSQTLFLTEPLGYLEFNYLVEHSKAIITDSGGITEETTVMGVPCMTLRNNTERPETVLNGTNELIGTNPLEIKTALDRLFADKWKKGSIPELWDGNASKRIILALCNL
jgi:UDP-N-acetylglucosamine 2-epimerase (non-hydrolysing)